MSVNSFPAQSSSPLGRNRSSLLSKFRSQLGQRNRSLADFYIEPDDPWRSYFPGDVVTGTVVLTVVRPVRITHLVISLHGVVKVFKNTVPSGEATPEVSSLGPGRGRRGAEYLGNGLATLFEDEVILCGEGRLKEGIYKFRFEMSFPPYALPSSISFERGTIAYFLTSTLTKPTTMNPTLTCRRRINLLENIDIAPFPAPKARIVTLEPVSKRSKSKAKPRSSATDPLTDSPTSLDPGHGASASDPPPLSPAPSNVSSSSHRSNSTQSFQITGSDPSSSTGTGVRTSEARSLTPSLGDRTITAKTEVLRAGVLPGDTLPIQVTIAHCKQVRSAHGIIVTLYRQGRIDLHPAIPVGRSAEGKKPVYEDYYPRSRTGLGGLTLGTSRSSSVFRKDLAQGFAPLVVDPSTLTAVVKTSIRIPEDTFPTITRTPGSMINFRYYVEVVVDLRGKVMAPDRFLPRFNLMSSGGNFSPSGKVLNSPDAGGGTAITANWSGNILDTDQIRREKGVVAVAFEVVIGTRDSHRTVSAQRTPSTAAGSDARSDDHGSPEEPTSPLRAGEIADPTASPADYGFPHPDAYWTEYPEGPPPPPRPFQSLGEMVATPPTEDPVDEKTRLRRAEQTLLPSQPPAAGAAEAEDAGVGPSSAPDAATPTAPVLEDDDRSIHGYQHLPSPAVDGGGGRSALPSADSDQTVVTGGPRVDDKQEMERRRLLMEASAPGDHDSPVADGPSAPLFHEDDDTPLVGRTAPADETLPRYQR
ncbi:pH response protein PalF [Aspergillus candidus]|uniref:Arrestin C-terminal-like domain-containing protein n=1 Tax=Aspergillus candidus TaxID=41067 RepID=A0A2I2FB91_ASPCN|nr:hypothetical protein BDW47DRAFT_131773 [Aspergillus candidus]PLB37897.1 hypothetical protein BDW47DRAFT_131773 [Aspergillus candidus]